MRYHFDDCIISGPTGYVLAKQVTDDSWMVMVMAYRAYGEDEEVARAICGNQRDARVCGDALAQLHLMTEEQ